MPEGSRNEWRDHFSANGAELEANAFFPLFWRVLFDISDIQYASFIDDFDRSDEETITDREECLKQFGMDTTYPYLVTDSISAIARLATKRETIIESIGEYIRPLYESFETLIVNYFPDHILLRTSGLPDSEETMSTESWLRASLTDIDNLRGSKELGSLMRTLAQNDVDAIWLLSGLSFSNDVWPPATLREFFPEPCRSHPYGVPAQSTWFDSLLSLIGVLIAAVATICIGKVTQSGGLAVLTLLCVEVAWCICILRVRGSKSH